MTGPRLSRNQPSQREAVLAQADERMAEAKRAFSAAVLATLREKPDAIARTRDALAAVDLARATLRELSDRREEER